MKLALIYDKDDHKLQDTSYSWIYKGMFNALVERFDDVTHIHNDCYYEDIDADVIIFYDVHATHHIRIDGIRHHKAVKMEYVSDPNQEEVVGVYKQFNKKFHKLGRQQRVDRFFSRGLDYVICPFKAGFHYWLGDLLGSDADSLLLYFPLAPTDLAEIKPITERKREILGNGAVRDGGEHIYDFRRWAFDQSQVSVVPHWVDNKDTPSGKKYMDFVSQYAGALALHDYFPVPKYLELPLAGCVTFAQYYDEYMQLGFIDGKTCIYVDKNNFELKTRNFLANMEDYQHIAEAGRKLVKNNYTAKHFADFIYNKVI